MNTANPRQHDARLPAALEAVTWDLHAHRQAVRARLADVEVLAEAITDPFVDRRVVIDQAVDLRRSLRGQAEQARQSFGSPGSTQRMRRGDDGHGQVTLAALEAAPQARTTRAVLAAALDASAGVVRPLAVALVGEADLQDVAERSVATCRRFLILADHLITTVETTCERE